MMSRSTARYFAKEAYKAFAYRGKDHSSFNHGINARVYIYKELQSVVHVWDADTSYDVPVAKSWIY